MEKEGKTVVEPRLLKAKPVLRILLLIKQYLETMAFFREKKNNTEKKITTVKNTILQYANRCEENSVSNRTVYLI